MRQTNYPIGDFFIRIKNAKMAGKKLFEVPKTKFIADAAKALVRLGYLEKVKDEKGKLLISLAYMNKEPVINQISIISKPGLRIYMDTDEIEKRKKPGVLMISTPQGVLSSKEALKKRVGGEVIAEIV